MADLPTFCITPNEPQFTRVGLDYFGPFLIKRARSEVKRYGCLFTCLATRAIHLEVSQSLDTDSFLNAMQRFIARRGLPKEVLSDNGTNLVGGHCELRKAISDWNQRAISDRLLQENIKWAFNPHLHLTWVAFGSIKYAPRSLSSMLCSCSKLWMMKVLQHSSVAWKQSLMDDHLRKYQKIEPIPFH